MRRTQCSACSAGDLETFLDLGLSPIADGYTASADEALSAPRYPLELAFCAKCGLVQLLEMIDAQALFGTGYSFYSSASPPLSAYQYQYACDMIRNHESVRRGVLEIGCNDGDFLRHFSHLPHLGIDPAAGPIEVARERGLYVFNQTFTGELARESDQMWPDGTPGLIVANHVLAHVEDVADMLAGISWLCSNSTIVMIEVQYLADLLVNNAFDLVYHEHRNFFSLSSLAAAAARHGLHVIDVELPGRQGGSLRATLARSEWVAPPSGLRRRDALLARESWLAAFGAYEGVQGRMERIRDRLLALIAERRERGDVGLYGAPGKATTLLNFCGLTSQDLSVCWDTTPAKQGRFIPGVGVEIIASNWPDGAAPATFLLAAWNYAESIIRDNRQLGADWILPFPAPIVVPS